MTPPAPDGAQAVAAPRPSAGRNTLVMVASHLVSRALMMVAFMAAARAAGPDVFGQINVALGVLTFLGLLADPGLHYVAQRELTSAPHQAQHLVAQMSFVRCSLTAIAVGATGLAYVVLRTPAALLTLLYAVTLVPTAVSLTWAYSGSERFGVVAISNVANAVIYAAWVLALVDAPSDVTLIPLGLLVANVAVALLQHALAPMLWRKPNLRAGRDGAWALLRSGLPFGTVLLLAQMLVWIDSFVLLALLDTRAVGIYHAAYRWVLFAVGLAAYFPQTLFPQMLRLGNGPQGEALMKHAISLTLQLGVFATLCLFGLSRLLVAGAFGADYLDAQAVLRLLSLLIPFAMHNALCVHYLNACKCERSSVRITAAAVVINVVLNVVLIQAQGVAGAALALVLTEVFIATMCAVALARVGVGVAATYGLFFTSALPAAVTLYFFPQPPLARGLAATGIFLLALAVTGQLSRQRLRSLVTTFWRRETHTP